MAVGCRQALRPPTEDDQAPETWITAAPFDTITLNKNGNNPVPTSIPVRFHIYWAGSDQDGAVVGFYWAVTETLPTPQDGFTAPPQLPGPKPQDYHYTTRTDSTFIFDVAEDVPDRQHTFYVYAVDNKGKADPTPARFVFTAVDEFPPIPKFQDANGVHKYGAYGVGTTYHFDALGHLAAEQDTFFVSDIDAIGRASRDTVSSNATMHFSWLGKPQIPGSVVTGYAYKLEEPDYIRVPASVTHVDYHTGIGSDNIPLSPGTKLFKIKALDQAGGDSDSTRRFELNFSPDTWWAGPDPNSPAWQVNWRGEKYVYAPNMGTAGIPGSLMSPDSTLILPALRPQRRSFLEYWQDTLFYRAEKDTIHLNSYAIFYNGGFDRDSRYLVHVTPLAASLPGFPGGVVLTPSNLANGSPVAFRSRAEVLLEPTKDAFVSNFAETGLYPLFDPNSVFDLPRIGVYHPMRLAGKAYIVSKAEDGDGARDSRVDDPKQIVEDVDSHQGGLLEQQARPLVMTFYVNRPPYLLTALPTFTPQAGHVFTDLNWTLDLPGLDDDPVNADGSTPVGNKSPSVTLRRMITVKGKDLSGNDLVWTDGIPYVNTESINFTIAAPLAPGPATLEVQLCDCVECETIRGSGSCITVDIPVIYQPSLSQNASSTRSGTR